MDTAIDVILIANVTSTLVWAGEYWARHSTRPPGLMIILTASNVPASTEETEPDDPLNNYITLISGQASAGQLVSRLNVSAIVRLCGYLSFALCLF